MQAEMGDEAVVLYQRRVATSRWWPFSARQWEVGAAQLANKSVPATSMPEQPIEADLAELKGKLSMLVQAASLARLPGCSEALIACYEQLCQEGLRPELSQALVLAARDELSSRAQTEPEVVRSAV